MSETDPDIDQVVKELVEWMDGWELEQWSGPCIQKETGRPIPLRKLEKSLDLVREIEVAVEDHGLWNRYGLYLEEELDTPKLGDFDNPGKSANRRNYVIATADAKDRLIALHRTLVEANEIQQEG